MQIILTLATSSTSPCSKMLKDRHNHHPTQRDIRKFKHPTQQGSFNWIQQFWNQLFSGTPCISDLFVRILLANWLCSSCNPEKFISLFFCLHDICSIWKFSFVWKKSLFIGNCKIFDPFRESSFVGLFLTNISQSWCWCTSYQNTNISWFWKF